MPKIQIRVGAILNKIKMKSEHTFTVDLGTIKLSPEQHQKVNSAIQKAVSAELAHLLDNQKIVLIPVHKWVKGPILDGIIARKLDEGMLEQILGH